MGFLTPDERAALAHVVDRLIPPQGAHPGAAALGAVDYIDALLDAFATDPPRIWAGGPFSGRAGGNPGFEQFETLSPREELAWRTRIEGSRGIPAREWNGPVKGWQAEYREGLAAPEDSARFEALVYRHACEACYGAPEYGGNRDTRGWRAIGFPGDVQPRGYTDAEVTRP